jgi:carboxymethylenebutenolidase
MARVLALALMLIATAGWAHDAPPAAGGDVTTLSVDYGSFADTPLRGYLAFPRLASGALPGVLVFHEWWGLNGFVKEMTRSLAAQGYVALALDFYEGHVATAPEDARDRMQDALSHRTGMADNVLQGYDFLKRKMGAKHIAALGWSFGGTMAYQSGLLLANKLDAMVIYYGNVGADPAELSKLPPVLAFFGAADSGIPIEIPLAFEQTLKALGRAPQLHIYQGADHAFANPSSPSYKADASADAWRTTLAFLDQNLKKK